MYETGGMRRTHLRHHPNILKRLLIHAGGFNLSLVLRKLMGYGKPRTLQDAYQKGQAALLAFLDAFWNLIERIRATYDAIQPQWSVTSPFTQAA